MRHIVVVLVAGAFFTGPRPTVNGAEQARTSDGAGKAELRTVTASVEYSTEMITGKQATLRPGEFTIPPGQTASHFLYRWTDPTTGRERDRLTASTVYSVTQRRYMAELKDNPDAVLSPGDYKLVVGGLPGAVGNLTYRLTKTDVKNPPAVTARGERIIDVVTWSATPNSPNYNPKLKATYHIRDGKVTGTVDQVVEPPQYERGITCDPLPTKGSFSGEIADNVITGKWEAKTAAHKMHFPAIPGSDYPAHDRTDSFTQSYESRLTLNADGTLSQTMKGSGVTEWVWGATAPKSIAGTRDSHRYEFAIPGKDHPEPMKGTWTERK